MNDFDRRVLRWVEQAMAKGPVDLPRLLKELPGCYPTDVVAAVERLKGSGLPGHRRHIGPRPRQPNLAPWYHGYLSEPHPLDYDWRFTETSAAEFLALGLGVSAH
jgi:hypothetical protein